MVGHARASQGWDVTLATGIHHPDSEVYPESLSGSGFTSTPRSRRHSLDALSRVVS
jgi:hypothetical protein